MSRLNCSRFRRAAGGTAVVVLVVLACLASSASAVESTIYPGVGIGKVRLGMTATQVKKILGGDYLLNDAENIRGRRYVEYGWDFSRWTVTFEQRGAKMRAVQVTTVVPSQKTPKRVGPGSTWRELARAYPRGTCTFNNQRFGQAELLVPHEGGTQTIYFVRQSRKDPDLWRVYAVYVRTPWVRLPEFQPSWNARCSDDWRTGVHP